MKVDVYNLKGEKSDTVELPDEIFAAKVNVDLMHQAYQRQMANARLGTHNTKRRGEVRGRSPAASARAVRDPALVTRCPRVAADIRRGRSRLHRLCPAGRDSGGLGLTI